MKVGIITHYYKSENYGGNLQAYALCKTINGLGHEAEQISFDRTQKLSLKASIKHLVRKMLSFSLENRANFKKRKNAFLSFNQGLIPHSKVYNAQNISECSEKYDAFITGSDQVLHPMAVCDEYLLKFASSSKIKLSYAASVACNEISSELKERYKKAFADFKALSVRENDAVNVLEGTYDGEISVTLDPTLLLSKEEWEKIADNSSVNEDYLFCYFLGDDKKMRALAKEYAVKHNLKIVTLPHLLGKTRSCDKNFGDINLFDVSPQRLLALIKEAKCVFTDSFHATVFSLIFEKEHFVFQRSGHKSMSSRIYTLCDMFGTNDRFCDCEEKANLSYIEKVSVGGLKIDKEAYLKQKESSIEFIKKNLT